MLEKLNQKDAKDFLSDSERELLEETFASMGNEDWVYDETTHEIKLGVKFLNKSNNTDPAYQKYGDSGFDLRAFITEPVTLSHEQRVIIPTGLYFQIPVGFELQVRPRSGLAANHGVMVVNSPGTVDSGFRGEIKVILYNTDKEPFVINNGDRIAQAVIAPVQTEKTITFRKVDTLDDSERGDKGFGSTGKL